MTTPVSNIIRRTLNTDKTKKLNILCFFLDTVFEQTILQTGSSLYGSNESYITQSLVPDERLCGLPDEYSEIPKDIKFDFVMCNHREGHLESAKFLSDSLHIPILIVEHMEDSVKLRHKLGNTVCSSEFLRNLYDGDEVIPYGVPMPKSDKERNIDLFIYGNFNNQDRSLVTYLQSLDFKTEVGGNNPGLSENLTFEEFQNKLLDSKVFLNLSYPQFTSSLLLHGMGAGCSVVSNKTNLSEIHIQHDETGLLESDFSKFAPMINKALDDRERLSTNAVKYIKENHRLEKVVFQWENKFQQIANQVYTR